MLFIVTKTESGWGWSNVAWVRYFIANSREVVETIVEKRYGTLDQYFCCDEVEAHIRIEEAEVEDLTVPRKDNERKENDF